MSVRTDLAVDISETLKEKEEGIKKKTETHGEVKVTTICIESAAGEQVYGKPRGTYITVEFPSLFRLLDSEGLQTALKEALNTLLPGKTEKKPMLVAGLGNTGITADAIGPKTAERILATRHIAGQFAENMGLAGLRSVAVIAPGVLGKTGIEATELIGGAVRAVDPAAVVVIDALASSSVSRLFQTVQLCDTGISPGSGVKNSRKEISRRSLGVPVIAVGVPTVVEAGRLAAELTGKNATEPIELFVTPKDADLLCEKAGEILSAALNGFLQPDLDPQILSGLT